MFVQYNGGVGSEAKNELGTWKTGESREVPDAFGAALIKSGLFEQSKAAQKPSDPED